MNRHDDKAGPRGEPKPRDWLPPAARWDYASLVPLDPSLMLNPIGLWYMLRKGFRKLKGP